MSVHKALQEAHPCDLNPARALEGLPEVRQRRS